MIKKTYTLILLFLTAFAFSQQNTLIQNVNPRAKALQHSLNKTGDILLLESEKTIFSVTIFNQDFERTFGVGKYQAKIPLHEVPKGRVVIEVQLNDGLIVMNLIKHKSAKENHKVAPTIKTEIADLKQITIAQNSITIKELINPRVNFTKTRAKTTKLNNKKRKAFWVMYKVNTGYSSRKSMKLGNKEEVDQLISKNKLDQKTRSGKLNKLIVWEVYDKSKFLRQQIINPDYINSSNSNFFDVSPYYTSENNFE